MAATRRIRPVRLTEVPVKKRIAAAQVAIRSEDDLGERALILFAALRLSSKVYWIAA